MSDISMVIKIVRTWDGINNKYIMTFEDSQNSYSVDDPIYFMCLKKCINEIRSVMLGNLLDIDIQLTFA